MPPPKRFGGSQSRPRRETCQPKGRVAALPRTGLPPHAPSGRTPTGPTVFFRKQKTGGCPTSGARGWPRIAAHPRLSSRLRIRRISSPPLKRGTSRARDHADQVRGIPVVRTRRQARGDVAAPVARRLSHRRRPRRPRHAARAGAPIPRAHLPRPKRFLRRPYPHRGDDISARCVGRADRRVLAGRCNSTRRE